MHFRRLAILLVLLCAMFSVLAQPTAPAPLTIPRTTAPIDLDGTLNDAAWKEAAVIDQFYETSPGDNIPAKVKTVAYVTYDDRYFYIGIRADDPEPQRIRAPFVDRDGVIGTDDNIAIFLDTRNDKRSAIELRVNPRGVQADGIFNDANSSEDFSPDFYYDTAATIDATGWSAEFRIPFSSLRYGSGDPQTWNILVWRNYPRDFRYAFHSAPIPRGANCHICFTHPLTGLTRLPKASHMVVAPYVTAQHIAQPEADLGSDLDSGEFDGDAGVDVKWTPSANAAFDLTLNPDFSQIEADVPQITVNRRFAVFFPEKRPFFLEGFDLFDTPMRVAYTRTITSPRFGARATGKRGSTAYTILATQDRGGGLAILPGPLGSSFAPQDFKSYATIGRVRHDIGSSFVGAVLTDREIDGGGHNRVFGPDGQWRPDDSHAVTAQFLISDTTNPNRPDLSDAWNGESFRSHAFRASAVRVKPSHDLFASLTDIGDGFRADLGFIPQVGYRDVTAGGGLSFYPADSKLRFIRPNLFVTRQTNQDNDKIYQAVSLGVNGFGAKNTQFDVYFRPKEQILVGGKILEQTYGGAFVQFDPSRRIPRISLEARVGQSIDFGGALVGHGAYIGLGATVRPTDRLDLQLNTNREWLDVDTGGVSGRLFTADVQRIRAQYSFSNKSLVRAIAQYVDNEFANDIHDGSFLGSVLYSYKLNWQTVLFVGYGDDRVLLENNQLVETGRSLFLKVSYAFLR
ncbi:MAG TPA: DUF5916 domain-containing protein [Thermoanaerobaculia bacterium]|nr:DUF5916 domain-containing protein [Thermoanaerobaculia bacterium]